MSEVGFEPTKLMHGILSPTPLTAREPRLDVFLLKRLNDPTQSRTEN